MRMLLIATVLLTLTSMAASAQERTVTLTVEKMTCALCAVTVTKVIKRVQGVIQVSVDYDTKRTTVRYDDAITTWQEVAGASASVGFPAIKVE
jgi:mercuric ion binding protein